MKYTYKELIDRLKPNNDIPDKFMCEECGEVLCDEDTLKKINKFYESFDEEGYNDWCRCIDNDAEPTNIASMMG